MAKREPKTPGEQSFHAWWSAFKEAGKGGPEWANDGDFDKGWAEEPDKELWERAAVETVRAFLRRAYEEALAPSLDGHVLAQLEHALDEKGGAPRKQSATVPAVTSCKEKQNG